MPVIIRPLDARLPDDEPDLLVMEIGRKGAMAQGAMAQQQQLGEVVSAFVRAVAAYSAKCKIAFTIGGYDDDPRPIWEVPEGRERFVELARLLFPSGYLPVIRERLEESTIAVLCQCGAWGTDHPFQVTITP
jgi:hypothetical protein